VCFFSTFALRFTDWEKTCAAAESAFYEDGRYFVAFAADAGTTCTGAGTPETADTGAGGACAGSRGAMAECWWSGDDKRWTAYGYAKGNG
jgi:hypothetical protein